MRRIYLSLRRIDVIISLYTAEINLMKYIHELGKWPMLKWDQELLAEPLANIRHRQGRLIGRMEGLGCQLRAEAVLQTLTEDVLKSSEIEGEKLDPKQVRSSLARRLGMDVGGLFPTFKVKRPVKFISFWNAPTC